MRRILPLLAVLAVASCGPVSSSSGSINEVSLWKTVSECLGSGHALLCAKEKALKITDRMRSMKHLPIVEGIILSNSEPTRLARSNEVSALDPSEREAQVEEGLVDNVEDILKTTVLQFKLPGASEPEDESLNGGRDIGSKKKGGKKKDKKAAILQLILKTKLLMLVPVFLGIIAVTLLKSVILAKITFIVIAATFLKKLLEKHHHKSHDWSPPVSHGWSGGGGGWDQGWDRSKIIDAQNLAYSGHVKA